MKWYKLLYKITGKLKVQQPIRSADVNGDVILEARLWYLRLGLESCIDNVWHHPRTQGLTTAAKAKLKVIIRVTTFQTM